MKHRCDVLVGEDDKTDEYIFCGAVATNEVEKGVFVCNSHHLMRENGQDLTIFTDD